MTGKEPCQEPRLEEAVGAAKDHLERLVTYWDDETTAVKCVGRARLHHASLMAAAYGPRLMNSSKQHQTVCSLFLICYCCASSIDDRKGGHRRLNFLV